MRNVGFAFNSEIDVNTLESVQKAFYADWFKRFTDGEVKAEYERLERLASTSKDFHDCLLSDFAVMLMGLLSDEAIFRLDSCTN